MKLITEGLKSNLRGLRKELGTWKAVSRATNIPNRTLRAIRNDQDQKQLTDKNFNKIQQALSKDLKDLDIIKSYPSHHTIKKYTKRGGFPSIDSNDFAYKKNDKYYAGTYSNKKTNQEISKSTYNRIRAGSQKQVRKINKAKHFLVQERYTGKDRYKKAYSKAQDWTREYTDIKNRQDRYAWYSQKSGRWHLGEKGAELTGKRKGGFLKEKEAKKLRGEMTEGYKSISNYLDRKFTINYINL